MRESDITLLQRYADLRDEAAFTDLVRRNMDAVYSAALRRTGGNAHQAKDVAQDVFVALAHNAERLRQYDTLAGWFFTATRNAAANRIRSEIRRRRREQEAQLMQDLSSTDNLDGAATQAGPVLDTLLDDLNEADRLAVLLRFYERRSFAQLGETSFAIFRDFERAQPAWELVNRFAGAMALQGEPLNEIQATRLATTLANASAPYRDGGKASLDTIDWDLVATESAEVLTPPQALSFLNSAPLYRVELSPSDPTRTAPTPPISPSVPGS